MYYRRLVAAGAAIYASTSVIDVEEDVELTSTSNAIISLTYDPISSDEILAIGLELIMVTLPDALREVACWRIYEEAQG